jgi:hypothetical protein
MSVSNGQTANATNFNAAFLSRTQASSTTAVLGLLCASIDSGASITDLQKQINAVLSFLGQATGGDADEVPTWASDEVGSANDPVFDRVDAISDKFQLVGGHAHSGAAGDGAPLSLGGLFALHNSGTPLSVSTTITFSTTLLLTAANVVGSGGPVTLTGTGQIPSMVNFSLILLIGTSDTDTVSLTPASDLKLNGVRTLAAGTTLLLAKIGGTIYEVSYNGLGGL